MGEWEPDEALTLRTPEKTVGADLHTHVYLWFVPADARGLWRGTLPGQDGEWRFRIGQSYQALEVGAWYADRELTRITSYNVCYTKLLRTGRSESPAR